MEVVQNTKKKMPSPSLTEGLALIESTSISMQQLMHHVLLKKLENAKKWFDFCAQVSNDFPLLRKAFEDVAAEQDAVSEINQVLPAQDVDVSNGDGADLPAADLLVADAAIIDMAVTDLPANGLPAANLPAADMAVVDMDLDITTTSTPSSQNSVDQPAAPPIVGAELPSDYLQALFGECKEPTHPTIDLFPATIVKSRNSGGGISHVLATSHLINLLANGTQDQAAKEFLTRLERIPQGLQDEVGNLILDPVYYYQRYCHKNLPRQVSFGKSVYEPGKIIKFFFNTNETLKMGSLSDVEADMDSQAACIPSDRSTYHHYIVYRSVSFQSLWLMEHFERFRHAVTIQLYGCRYACWRTIVTIALPAFREFHNMPHIRLLHYVDSTPSTIGDIRGMDFTILYVYLYDMVNANMISVKSILKQIEDKAYLFDQFKDVYQDLQGYLMHRYRLPFDLLKMAEEFDIKDHKPKDQGVALRLDGFDLDTPAGQWQQIFENLYRQLKCQTVNASWYKTGDLIICEKCRHALPALFSFDKNFLKPGDNHEDPHPICRMCQLVPTCNGLLRTAVNAYVPTISKDAEEKRKPKFEDGDPHKPVAPEDVNLSTWVVPESTGASMQVEQHLRYEATLFSPIHVMRRSPQPPKLPPVPPKLIKSKTFFRELKLLQDVGMDFPAEFDTLTNEQFAEIKASLLVKYKALGNDCSEIFSITVNFLFKLFVNQTKYTELQSTHVDFYIFRNHTPSFNYELNTEWHELAVVSHNGTSWIMTEKRLQQQI
ncbi:hypothetical protein BTUL_0021g00400 [Botrytis tulipae]|uniref:Uncharacterized protein n=1 Tax=Botrytis tulipae TaxID=87230 RepID=A0A4Z1F2Q5_9HELO|nr:hypothetical protein BTUL_0021g00400 [Botrytis tulipae]